MSAIVGPSQRVCSRPDAGQHGHLGRDHVGGVVAPAQPRLDHRHLHLARRQLVVGGGGQRLELGHGVVVLGLRALHDLGRLGRPLDGRGEALARHRLLPHLDPLAERGQVRRGVAAGAQPVALQHRGGEAHGRRLAVGAHHVHRREPALGHAQRGGQPVHALQAEAHAEQLQAQQVLLGLAQGPGGHQSRSQRRRVLGQLAALALDHVGGRALHEPRVAELLLQPLDLAPQPVALALDPAARLGGVEVGAGQQLHRAARAPARWPPPRPRPAPAGPAGRSAPPARPPRPAPAAPAASPRA